MTPFKIIGGAIALLFLWVIYIIICIPTIILFFIKLFFDNIVSFIERILFFLQGNVFGNLNMYKNKLYKKIMEIIHNTDDLQK